MHKPPHEVETGARELRLDAESGQGVMLVHGLTGAPSEMRYLARQLRRRGFSVRVPLLAGHGVDSATLLRTTWHDWLESLDRALTDFRKDVDAVCVAGICAGGALGVALAAERPEVRAVAVYSMTFHYDGWNITHWQRAVAPLLERIGDLPGLRAVSFAERSPFGLKDEALRASVASSLSRVMPGAMDRFPIGGLYQTYRLGQHVERVGRRVRQPVLILHAREDDMSDPRNALRLRAALGGPVHLEIVDDCYHMLHVDKQRRHVADLTARFFGAPLPLRSVQRAPAQARRAASTRG